MVKFALTDGISQHRQGRLPNRLMPIQHFNDRPRGLTAWYQTTALTLTGTPSLVSCVSNCVVIVRKSTKTALSMNGSLRNSPGPRVPTTRPKTFVKLLEFQE